MRHLEYFRAEVDDLEVDMRYVPGRWMFPWLVGLILCCEMALGSPWIDGYVGRASDFRLEREGEELDIEIFQPLRPGDRISVVKPGSRKLTVRYEDGTAQVVTAENSPWLVSDPGVVPTVSDNLLEWMQSTYSQLVGDTSSLPINLVTRQSSMPSLLPVVPTDGTAILAGRSPLTVKWKFGVPPTTVELRQSGSAEIVHRAVVTEVERSLVYEVALPVGLMPGSYDIRIRDASEELKIGFSVIDDSIIPAPPAMIANSGSLMPAARAMWLLTQDIDRWSYVAYQLAEESSAESSREIRELIERHNVHGPAR